MANLDHGLSIDLQKEFAGVRTRFQRLTDYRFFAGWIQDFFGQRILVRASPDVVLMTGQEFSFEVYGQETIATFMARLEYGSDFGLYDPNASKGEFEMRQRVLSAADVEFEFVMTSQVTRRSTTEEARRAAQSSTAIVTYNGESICGTVVDISKSGLAVVLPAKLDAKSDVQINVTTHMGEVQFNANVRYCRADKLVPNSYRVGFQITFIDRIDRARWNRI